MSLDIYEKVLMVHSALIKGLEARVLDLEKRKNESTKVETVRDGLRAELGRLDKQVARLEVMILRLERTVHENDILIRLLVPRTDTLSDGQADEQLRHNP